MARYLLALGHERFTPTELLEQIGAGEDAGFDLVACSDHTAPWWTTETAPTACGNAWVWLGAAAQATSNVEIGTGVTALVHRYNPLVVAQQTATLEALAPGRAFLGVGSGEAMNEVPAGMDWPSTEEQLARTEEALTIVTRALDGEAVDFDGRFFRTRGARLWFKPDRRPPVYMSAFYEGAAEVAGRLADGLWTLGDPEQAPKVIEAYRRSCEEAGREPGEVILQALFSWAEDEESALAGAREWKGTMVDAMYTDDVHDPAEVYRRGEAEISDDEFLGSAIVSSDPEKHVERIGELEDMGATIVGLMNVSGRAPLEALRVYGRDVLPNVRSRAFPVST